MERMFIWWRTFHSPDDSYLAYCKLLSNVLFILFYDFYLFLFAATHTGSHSWRACWLPSRQRGCAACKVLPDRRGPSQKDGRRVISRIPRCGVLYWTITLEPCRAALNMVYRDHHSEMQGALCGVQKPLSTLNLMVETPCSLLYAPTFGVETVCRKRNIKQIHFFFCVFTFQGVVFKVFLVSLHPRTHVEPTFSECRTGCMEGTLHFEMRRGRLFLAIRNYHIRISCQKHIRSRCCG